jgi:hypothetical protein
MFQNHAPKLCPKIIPQNYLPKLCPRIMPQNYAPELCPRIMPQRCHVPTEYHTPTEMPQRLASDNQTHTNPFGCKTSFYIQRIHFWDDHFYRDRYSHCPGNMANWDILSGYEHKKFNCG